MSSVDAFLRGGGNSSSSGPKQDSFVEGTCHHVTDDGLFFTVDSWDGGKYVFGPAPWPVGPTEPPTGARVLVLFLGAGVDRQWVLGWWP